MATEGTRNKFLLCNFCFRPVVDVDGVLDPATGNSRRHGNVVDNKLRRKQKQQHMNNISVSENVADNTSSPSRPRNHSLSRILKAVMFDSALTRRIRRRKSSKRKFYVTSTGQSMPTLAGGGLSHGEVKEIDPDDPHVLSSSLPSESKRTDYTADEIVSEYDSDMGTLNHGMNNEKGQLELVQGSGQKRQPTSRKLTTTAFSLLNHCGVHVFLTVLGVTVVWGKAGAILFTSIWLYSIFFQRIARRRRIGK
ncbi:uncharacterized protein LOC116205497 [Punica granatum]|uniref:Uncharacterized protein n=2 Tax=Punica granatum TaxID=22663 RepID=A0A218Y1N2_PUNGR|nr:uncharacterized protein LOC116203389 [Punica granatum]XP_031393982.1 uncharacterized protein LOC116205497 [Punica granatum]OWM90978.1 hypothetical protein CDL15_Pgr023311 [Punica granatum]OWM90980.1 hypothetical protein CDL15_Pgr023313 [Punica granatum]PKH48014.1 hypothetical protein CRG98_050377 [Punica granatum]